ncbi:hypothetical protein PQR71_10440 [Paraburkholderia fungorum]|uniref:hypothetical protein n=1 Tax=Paraburkholderia fungorum TaxID=134537 RepID=UPI0038B92E29
MFEEVSKDARDEMSGRLLDAEEHFMRKENWPAHTRAQVLGAKIGEMTEQVTHYDMIAAEEFLTRHGLGRTASAPKIESQNNQQDVWISAADQLPKIPATADHVRVFVLQIVDGVEHALKAFYVAAHSGLNPIDAPCFVMTGYVLDRLNLDGATPQKSEIIDPSHWRYREA